MSSKIIGNDIKFERVRRLTGYLAATEHFNNAKKAEEKERIKHR